MLMPEIPLIFDNAMPDFRVMLVMRFQLFGSKVH